MELLSFRIVPLKRNGEIDWQAAAGAEASDSKAFSQEWAHLLAVHDYARPRPPKLGRRPLSVPDATTMNEPGSAIAISIEQQPDKLPPEILENGRVQCPICKGNFKNHKGYVSHRYRVHGIVERYCVGCPVDGCSISATNRKAICSHMETTHGFKRQSVETEFENLAELKKWLLELETTDRGTFINSNGLKPNANTFKLYCNRSGKYRPPPPCKPDRKPLGKRSMLKIGKLCPAYINCLRRDDGKLRITGQLAHYGHGAMVKVKQELDDDGKPIKKKRIRNKPIKSAVSGRLVIDAKRTKTSVDNDDASKKSTSGNDRQYRCFVCVKRISVQEPYRICPVCLQTMHSACNITHLADCVDVRIE